MTTVNPTQPLHALRQTARTCHELGVCMNPTRSCGAKCEQAMQRLAPGVIDGPYQRSISKASTRTPIMLKALFAATVVIWVCVMVAKSFAIFGVNL